MPAPDISAPGAPIWIDLASSDVPRSRAFYGELFGWDSSEPDEQLGGYFSFTRGGARVAGGMHTQAPEQPDGWSVYLTVADAKGTVDAAAARGGQVIVAPMQVADLGTMAVVTDPGGAPVGLWQPETHRGFEVVREHGSPGWFELHTLAYAPVLDFYREVFGWTTQPVSDTEEFRYSVLQHGEEQLAGVMDDTAFASAGPAYWAVYFAVDGTDAAVQRAVELGGAVVQEAEDTPYGRLAGVTDPTGAAFKLIGPNVSAPAGG